jgi:hypothetical protein
MADKDKGNLIDFLTETHSNLRELVAAVDPEMLVYTDADVGGDLALPVTDDYPEGESNQFSGKIHWVRVDLEEDNVSHLEPEELKYHRALARQ